MKMKNEENFRPASRVNRALTASSEKRALLWMAHRAPQWLSSDQLTAFGFIAQIGAGLFYALSRWNRHALLLVILCMVLNWLGDSLDGTLARVRGHERPRYGFYIDHMADVLGSVALMCGLGLSGFVHWQTALALLIAFLILSSESYLATYTLSRFQLSQGFFGPTELRILLVIGNLTLLRNPYCTILGHRLLLFDVGGSIAVVCMFALAIRLAASHAAQLYREEPLE
jgi:phosphatidylglycerophosphate synthase